MAGRILLPLALVAAGLAQPALARGRGGGGGGQALRYEPTWASLDRRPLPEWYVDAKFGIFIHFGVFSVPGLKEWFWYEWQTLKDPDIVQYMEKNYPPTWTYQAFAPQFTASLFDPTQWAELFAASGAKYVVLTSKHHEGYTLYDSPHSPNWNAKDVGPGRDLVGELRAAVSKTDLRFGLYHSLYEWYHPLYLQDKANGFRTDAFVAEKTGPELIEIVERYKPEVLWSDGDWEAPPEYWNSTAFLAWLYNDSPVRETVLTNDRWGQGTSCQHGGFYSCQDRFSPGVLQPHYFESCQTLDKQAWGYRRDARLEDFQSLAEVLRQLVTVVATNGNLLLNVGPDKDGIIHPIFEERLRQVGSWLARNGAAIYGSRPWARAQNDTLNGQVWYTTDKRQSRVYAMLLEWPSCDSPEQQRLRLGAPRPTSSPTPALVAALPGAEDAAVARDSRGRRRQRRRLRSPEEEKGDQEKGSTVSLLGYEVEGLGPLAWEPVAEAEGGGIAIDLSDLCRQTVLPKRDWAWTFVLEGFA